MGIYTKIMIVFAQQADSQAETYPFQNNVRHGGVGIHYDGGSLVITDLLEKGGGILAVIQHANGKGFLGDEKLSQ